MYLASSIRKKLRNSILTLLNETVSPDDTDFWDEFWKLPITIEDFAVISPNKARRIRDDRFDNLGTMFTQATAQLCQIVETPFLSYFDQALNCVRVLTFIIPFLLEKGDLADPDPDVERLCWGTGMFPQCNDDVSRVQDDPLLGKVIGGENEELSQEKLRVNTPTLRKADDATAYTCDYQKPLALMFIHAIINMLFLREFTIPGKENISSTIVWASGCGVTPNQLGNEGGTRKFDKNRVEVLRLLLAACCDPLFSPAHKYNPLASRWLLVCVAADAPNTINLFYSLMNTIISYDPNSGVPYSSAFSSDDHMKLVELSSQVLCVLLDCGLSSLTHPVNKDWDEPILELDVTKCGFNMFRTLIARMDSERDFNFIYSGITRLLQNTYESQNTYLPNSTNCLQCFPEILILCWKLLEENPLFMIHILTQCDVTELIVPICFLMYQSRLDPTQIGLIHLCTFILLKFSGERKFGVNLMKPFDTKLACDIPVFTGGHADLICITLHKLIANGSYKLVPLYSCFITVLCNVSPYWRSITLIAANKLVNLFELFSSPKFLYSGDKSYHYLALLLELFNNVIQYQFQPNPNLIYAIIRRKDSFGKLVSLTLPKVISQCQKVYGETPLVQYDADVSEKHKTDNTQGDKSTDSYIIDNNYFQPTEKWLLEMKDALPLETITRFLQHLVPVVDEIVDRQDEVDENDIIEVLKEVTLIGLIPVPHAIAVRPYKPNRYTPLWFTKYMWGIIFLRNQSLPIFDGKGIKLFQVKATQEDGNESDI